MSNESLQKHLIDNAIISGDVNNKCRIVYFESKRKRYVYAKSLNCYYRQRIQIVSQGKNLHLLLIDPFESRAEVALLHMPIETNPAVIEHIFQSLNPEWKASAIKQVPGEQMRADRWKLLVACSDKRLIPQGFVLPEMGPERQDVNVKVFVRVHVRRVRGQLGTATVGYRDSWVQ